MKLKNIITASNWEAVCKVFLSNYSDQKKSIAGYKAVYNKLRNKSPKTSKMELNCYKGEPDFKGDEPYHGVNGVDGTKREDGSLEHFSLSLSPWSEWLGSQLSEKTLNNYTNEEIITHCLYDMTFYGFSETKIKEFNKELEQSSKDSKDPIRYIIVSNLFPTTKWQCYFNVSDEVWCSDIDSATTFKRENYASAILKALDKGKDNSNIIARITTKNKKRKVLKYYR